MSHARVPDWFQKMTAVIAEHDRAPFAWGSADCFNFAMDVVAAVRGVDDPFVKERRSYTTEKGAAKALRKLKAANANDLLAREFEEIAPAMANVGDIMTVEKEDGMAACGICIGHELIMRGEVSLCRVPRHRASKAFRV